MPTRTDHALSDVAIPLARQAGASAHERLVDTLAKLLLEAEDALVLLSEPAAANLQWVEPDLRIVFDAVNALLLRLAD